jgi:hypothetical protein
MARVQIYSDERFPFFGLHEEGTECEVPREVKVRWKRVMAEFEQVQTEMEKRLEKKLVKIREEEARRPAPPPKPKEPEPVFMTEFFCLNDVCNFSNVSMNIAQQHEDENGPNVHPVAMRTKRAN